MAINIPSKGQSSLLKTLGTLGGGIAGAVLGGGAPGAALGASIGSSLGGAGDSLGESETVAGGAIQRRIKSRNLGGALEGVANAGMTAVGAGAEKAAAPAATPVAAAKAPEPQAPPVAVAPKPLPAAAPMPQPAWHAPMALSDDPKIRRLQLRSGGYL